MVANKKQKAVVREHMGKTGLSYQQALKDLAHLQIQEALGICSECKGMDSHAAACTKAEKK